MPTVTYFVRMVDPDYVLFGNARPIKVLGYELPSGDGP
jgi:hypothetical protein